MTLGEKIQNCRKLKGVSQEEVASALGVSRQALSKWECNTSTPDIDKIVALSNYFNVTTDYLLKDECTDMNIHFIEEEKKLSGNIPIIVSTAIIIIGLFVTFAKTNDGAKFLYWEFSKAALGIGIQVVGICVLEVLYYSNKFQMKNQYFFWSINTWLLSIMPIILILSALARILNNFRNISYIFFIVLFYFIFNLVITWTCLYLSKRSKAEK